MSENSAQGVDDKEKITQLENENDQLKSTINQLNEGNQQLNNEINNLKNKNEESQNEIHNLKNKNEELHNEINDLKSDNEQLVPQIKALKDQIEQLKKEHESAISHLRNQTMTVLNTKSCLNEQERRLEECFQKYSDSERNLDQSNQPTDEASGQDQNVDNCLQTLRDWIENQNYDIALSKYLHVIHKIQLSDSIHKLPDEINEESLFNYMLELYRKNLNDPYKSMVFSPLKKLSKHQLNELHKLEDFDPAYLSPELVKWMMDMIWQYLQVRDTAAHVCHIIEQIDEKSTTKNDLIHVLTLEAKKYNSLIENQLEGKMVIKEGVTKINSNLYKGQQSIKVVTLPASLKEICMNAFYQCTKLTTIDLKCETLESIGKSAFADCISLKEFKVPQGIKFIEERAFSGCSKLEKLELPDDLEEIRNEAFSGCKSLQSVKLSKNFKKLGKAAFKDCRTLSIFEISGVLSIAKDLSDISNDNSAKSDLQFTFSEHCFEGCTNLTYLRFYKISSLELGESAFYNCCSIKAIEFDLTTTTAIKGSVFGHCSSLERINLPEDCNVDKCNYLFDGCENLQTVQLPKTVTGIPIGMFRCCSKLTQITVGDKDIASMESLIEIGDFAFQNNTNLKWTQLPPKLETVGKGSFENDTQLSVTSFPQSIKTIGEMAFTNSGLTRLIIQNVANGESDNTNVLIDNYAFSKCLSLKEAYIDNSIECSSSAFSDTNVQLYFTNLPPENFAMCNFMKFD